MQKRELYDIDGDDVDRQRKECPKCGEGVFLAQHSDRLTCGRCAYTEFNE